MGEFISMKRVKLAEIVSHVVCILFVMLVTNMAVKSVYYQMMSARNVRSSPLQIWPVKYI